jgi:hypothetical protein
MDNERNDGMSDIRRQLLQETAASDQQKAMLRNRILEMFSQQPHRIYDYLFEQLDDLQEDAHELPELDFIIAMSGVVTVVDWVHERLLNGRAKDEEE